MIIWLGSAPKKNRVRARGLLFILIFFEFQGIFMSLSAYFSQKEKKVARANPGARGNPNDFLLLLM